MIVLLIMAGACTWSMKDALQRVHVWSAGFLLGSFDLLMRELNGWHILMQQFGPFLPSTVLLAAVVFLLGRHPVWQLTAVTVGLLSSECAYLWLHRASLSPIWVGRAAFADHWWLTLGAARLLTVSIEQTARLAASSYRHWAGKP
ncbi:hypothetical protein [Gorillibacterium sp. sgz5001074]|uniref:hypothetical protein n=1 Tax=Gorillibacterium sp. sgz5001074 TaxID=3446695 RepID=UPI003F667310